MSHYQGYGLEVRCHYMYSVWHSAWYLTSSQVLAIIAVCINTTIIIRVISLSNTHLLHKLGAELQKTKQVKGLLL